MTSMARSNAGNGTSRGSAIWTRLLASRNYWYPVLFSHELKEGETRPETLLGERLFFKRINDNVLLSRIAACTGGALLAASRVLHDAHINLLVSWLYIRLARWQAGRDSV